MPVDGESFYLANVAVGELSEGLDTPVQLLYLVFLMGFLVVGAYLVVRQVRDPYHMKQKNVYIPTLM